MSKRKMIIFSVIILVIVFLSLILYSFFNQSTKSNGNNWRTEKQPIADRFSILGNFDKCYWKADTIGENSRLSVPGPTAYWMKGFVILSGEDFKNLKEKYKWDDVNVTWEPSLDTKILNIKTFKWTYSEEFNNINKSSGFVGKFYLDLQNGIVFFDVQK